MLTFLQNCLRWAVLWMFFWGGGEGVGFFFFVMLPCLFFETLILYSKSKVENVISVAHFLIFKIFT